MNRAKRQTKKLLSIVAALLLCLVPVSAEPATGIAVQPPEEPGPTVTEATGLGAEPTAESPFEFDAGTITGYKGPATDVVIPEDIGGVPVTAIGEFAFSGYGCNIAITSIVIPATVTTIGDCAFFSCSSLKTVHFNGCPETWGANVLGDDTATVECHIDYKDQFKTALAENLYPAGDCKLTTYGEPSAPAKPMQIEFTTADNADGCTVTGFTIVDNGAEIPAAYPIEIPAQIGGKPVTAIGEQAFLSSRKVERITLPEGLRVISSGAFQGCSALTEITIPASVETIGDRAFLLCSSLQNIHVAAGNASYCDVNGVLFSKDKTVLAAFPGGRTGAYEVPEGTTRIAADAFRSGALTDVSFPQSLSAIGDRAFQSSRLEKAVVPAHVAMGTYVYANCEQAKSIEVAEGVTEITDSTFHGLQNCENVSLPRTLKVIGDNAFRRLKAENITLPEGLENIGKQAFESSRLTSVKVPASVKEMGYGAFLSAGKLTNVQFAPGSHLKDLPDAAFGNCYYLDQVHLPKGLTTIGSYAFIDSGIKKIHIPDSVTTLGNSAFKGCSHLKDVTLPKNLNSVGQDTFKDCPVSTVSVPQGFQYDILPSGTFPEGSVTFTTRSTPSFSYDEPAELPKNPVTGGQKFAAMSPAPAHPADPVAPITSTVPETAPHAQKVLPKAPAAVEATAETARSIAPLLFGICLAGVLLTVGTIGILKKRKGEQK